MKEHTPFMDLHPELDLVPASLVSIPIYRFCDKFDYVQNLSRKSSNSKKDNFYLLVKGGKFGVLYYYSGFGLFNVTAKVALDAQYDSLKFIYKQNKSFGAIVTLNGKYGLFFWELGIFGSKKLAIPVEYDFMELFGGDRVKAIKGDQLLYFDITGRILK